MTSDFDPDRAARRSAERAVDRSAHLEVYRAAGTEGPRAEATPANLDDPTVKNYVARLSPAETEERLRRLGDFCAFAGEEPGEMIAGIFDRENYRYVRRAHYTQQILDFSASFEGTWEERTATGDVVRAFFLANGHRIAPAVPQWHLWLRMG